MEHWPEMGSGIVMSYAVFGNSVQCHYHDLKLIWLGFHGCFYFKDFHQGSKFIISYFIVLLNTVNAKFILIIFKSS